MTVATLYPCLLCRVTDRAAPRVVSHFVMLVWETSMNEVLLSSVLLVLRVYLLLDSSRFSVCKSDLPSSFNHTNDNHVQMEVSKAIRSFSQSRTLSGGRMMVHLRPLLLSSKDFIRIFGELMGLACRATMTSVSNAALSLNVSTIVRRRVRRSPLHSCQTCIHCRMTVPRYPARLTTLKCVPCGPSLRSVKYSIRTVPCPTRRFFLDMASSFPKTNMTRSEWCSARYRQ